MIKTIIFDMDGTIADLYGVDNWLEMLQAENPEPYAIAEPMVDILALTALLDRLIELGWQVAITSWLAMDSSKEYKQAVRQAKNQWLEDMGIPYTEKHLVQYGTPKQKCTKGDLQILIDDSETVRQSFENPEKGRYAFNPEETDIISLLKLISLI